jgi:hypothetical protein
LVRELPKSIAPQRGNPEGSSRKKDPKKGPLKRRRPMAPKTTRKSTKKLAKAKKMQPVKNLRIHVRKAGSDPLGF